MKYTRRRKQTPHKSPGLLFAIARLHRRAMQRFVHWLSNRPQAISFALSAGADSNPRKDAPFMQVMYCTCGRPDCTELLIAVHRPQMSETADGSLVPYIRLDERHARRLAHELKSYLEHRTA